MATHYETLGVPRTASTDQIRRAYHTQARRWHPDRVGGRSSGEALRAEDAMRRVNEAWRVLGDVQRRRQYDRELDGALRAAGGAGATASGATAAGATGTPRIDPRLFDPAYVAARREAQYEQVDRGHVAVLRVLPWVAVLGFLAAIVVFTAYQGGPGGEDEAGVPGAGVGPVATVPALPSIGVPAGACVRILSGPTLQEVPCSGIRDGVVVGVKLDAETPCPAPADQEVELRDGTVVCLAP